MATTFKDYLDKTTPKLGAVEIEGAEHPELSGSERFKVALKYAAIMIAEMQKALGSADENVISLHVEPLSEFFRATSEAFYTYESELERGARFVEAAGKPAPEHGFIEDDGRSFSQLSNDEKLSATARRGVEGAIEAFASKA